MTTTHLYAVRIKTKGPILVTVDAHEYNSNLRPAMVATVKATVRLGFEGELIIVGSDLWLAEIKTAEDLLRVC